MIKRRIILASGECPWNCYFCGYGSRKPESLSPQEMKEQIDNYFKGFEKGKIDKLKVDTFGSFLNKEKVTEEVRRYIIRKCREYSIDELEVETRPEFVEKENLSELGGINVTLAIGLDVADDFYLKKLNKGFTVSNYEDAAQIAKSMGFGVKTYVLVNPPFVENEKKILDKTAREALKFSDKIVLVNCYLHEETPLEDMLSSDEEIDWEPLSKEEFFELTKDWLVKPNVNYDVRRKEVPPTWKAWIPRFSDEEDIVGVSEEELVNSKYETWQKFLTQRYNPPENRSLLLFLPDSQTKPFSESELHMEIEEALANLNLEETVHRIILSSPGVIPMEFEDYYPFDSYEWDPGNLDEEMKKRYVEVVKERVKKYIENHRIYYDEYFHLFKSDSLNSRVMKEVSKDLDVEIKSCFEDVEDSSEYEEALKTIKEEVGEI